MDPNTLLERCTYIDGNACKNRCRNSTILQKVVKNLHLKAGYVETHKWLVLAYR